MADGVIVKILSGFYYISYNGGIVECRARGRLRFEGLSPIVGDRVSFSETKQGTGVIDKIYERRNSFLRPAVANIDLMIIVACAAVPSTDPFLIDRVAAVAAHENCDVAICVNKSDINRGDHLFDVYLTTGYKVIRTSCVTGEGITELRELIWGKISAVTGNTGVGKSSVLNALCPELFLNTGEISHKLGRGRHTTRHVELFSLNGEAYVADTPGFSAFEADQARRLCGSKLDGCFPEFEPYLGQCRFNDCVHISEPGCRILTAISEGKIHPSRHFSYVRMIDILSKIRE